MMPEREPLMQASWNLFFGRNTAFVAVSFTSSPESLSFVLAGCKLLLFIFSFCYCSSFLLNVSLLSVLFPSLILVADSRLAIL